MLTLGHAVQALEGDMPLATLFSRHPQDVAEAFGENNIEARLWVARMKVSVIPSLAPVAAEPGVAIESPAVQLSAHAPEYQLPTVNSNQTAVANEIILRILIAKGTQHCHGAMQHATSHGYQLGMQ